VIEISKAAIAEIKRMQTARDYRRQTEGQQVTIINLRVGFTNGGCENFYYTIDLTDSIHEHERVCTVNGISVAIDRQHLAYLDNLKLDYAEDLMGGGFRFENPLATSVCGCGNSFAIANVESERWQLPT
jgi:iron-sulfur cluster assembly protein